MRAIIDTTRNLFNRDTEDILMRKKIGWATNVKIAEV